MWLIVKLEFQGCCYFQYFVSHFFVWKNKMVWTLTARLILSTCRSFISGFLNQSWGFRKFRKHYLASYGAAKKKFIAGTLVLTESMVSYNMRGLFSCRPEASLCAHGRAARSLSTCLLPLLIFHSIQLVVEHLSDRYGGSYCWAVQFFVILFLYGRAILEITLPKLCLGIMHHYVLSWKSGEQ